MLLWCTRLKVFPSSVSWWFSIGLWVTASLLKFPAFFLVFGPVSILLSSFGWSPLVLLFPSPPVHLSILWWLYRAHQLQSVTPSFSCYIVFSSLVRSRDLFLFLFLSVLLCDYLERQSSLFFYPKYKRILCLSFSKTESGLCMYHLFVWSNFSFLHNSQWTTLFTQSCVVLYSFCASLLHSPIM